MGEALVGLGLLVGLLCLAFGVGAFLLRRLPLAGLERAVFALALGLGAISGLVFALGLLKLARPLPLALGVLALGLGLGVPGGLHAWRTRGPKQEAEPAGPLALACALALAAAGLCALLGAIAPPSWLEWDALSYHLAVPKTYLREGRIFFIPYDHHANFPFALQMLYLLMLAQGSVAGAKLVHWFCAVLLVLSVVAFAQRHLPGGKQTGLIAAVVLASTPIVLWEASVAYVDLATALFSWLALYALVNVHAGPDRRTWLVLSAVLMGIALGTKMTVLGFWGMGLLGLFAARAVPRRDAALWGGLSLLVGAPWYLKTWLYTGNPVYPFFYSLFGGRYWSAEIAAQYAAEQGKFGYGKGPLALLLSPIRVSLERWLTPPPGRPFAFSEYALTGGYDLGPLYLVLTALTLPFALRKLPRPALLLLAYGAGVFAFWFVLMQQTRYLLPALPAAALVAATALTLCPKPVQIAGGALVAAGAVYGLATASVGTAGIPGIAIQALPFVTGSATRNEYVVSRDGFGAMGEACLWINENAPADVKVALFNDTEGFYLDREYVWAQPDHHHGLIPWETFPTAEAMVDWFRARRYLVWLDNTKWAAEDGKPWRAIYADAIARGLVQLVFEKGAVRVYRVL